MILNVALTSDSGRAKKDYVSITAHFIDDDLVLHKCAIGFKPLYVRNMTEVIADRVLNILVD